MKNVWVQMETRARELVGTVVSTPLNVLISRCTEARRNHSPEYQMDTMRIGFVTNARHCSCLTLPLEVLLSAWQNRPPQQAASICHLHIGIGIIGWFNDVLLCTSDGQHQAPGDTTSESKMPLFRLAHVAPLSSWMYRQPLKPFLITESFPTICIRTPTGLGLTQGV